MSSSDEQSKHSRPTLVPGIYLLDSRHIEPGLLHIIFWPEDSTWTEDTTLINGRNRVTFMRYLTKLCDQLVCLMSDEDSAKIVWKEEDPKEENTALDPLEQFDRLFSFMVEEINEEKETVKTRQGFTAKHPTIKKLPETPPGFPSNLSIDILQPQVVVGHTSQALLEVKFQPEKWSHQEGSEPINALVLGLRLSREYSPNLVLPEDLDKPSLEMLLKHGLWSRCGNLEQEWRNEMVSLEDKRISDRLVLLTRREEEVNATLSNFNRLLPVALIEQTIKYFPALSGHRDTLQRGILESEFHNYENIDLGAADQEVMNLIESHPLLMEEKKTLEDLKDLEESKNPEYGTLKQVLCYAQEAITKTGLSPDEIHKLVESVNQKGKNKKWFSSLQAKIAELSSKFYPGNKTESLPAEDDVVFFAGLGQLTEKVTELKSAAEEVKSIAVAIIQEKIKKLRPQIEASISRGLDKNMADEIAETFDRCQSEEEVRAWSSLQERINAYLTLESQPNASTLTILKVSNSSDRFTLKAPLAPSTSNVSGVQTIRQSGGTSHVQHKNNGYTVGLLSQAPIHLTFKSDLLERAGLKFTLRKLEVKQGDLQLALNDKSHICRPTMGQSAQTSFSLPLEVTMRYV
ncbi:hypothetical protein CPB86DRAFT_820903 [Serendipita vermifera]|nr:hypothetical protein CPB86DRAFT_820903 [Serendipita vermifera]